MREALRAGEARWTNTRSVRDAHHVDARLLVVEPDPAVEGRWRFGRLAAPEDELGAGCGILEERGGSFHLVSGGGDAIAALLLVRNCDGPPRRLVYEPPSPASPGPPAGVLERAVAPRSPRVVRSTRGRSKGGGETLAARADRFRRQR